MIHEREAAIGTDSPVRDPTLAPKAGDGCVVT